MSRNSFKLFTMFSKNILITGGEINCQGEGILIEEFPRLNFVCSLNFKNKKNFFKKLKINKKVVDKLYSLNVEGSLNLFNRKINFKKINTENGYTANEEDIKFFKEKFDSILFNEGFFKIFKKSKIRTFVLEIL